MHIFLGISLFHLGAVHKLCHLGRGVGEGGSPKDDFLNRPYFIKNMGEGVKNHQLCDNIVYRRPFYSHYKICKPGHGAESAKVDMTMFQKL